MSGWNSPELLEACTRDPHLKPEEFFLPDQYQDVIGGKTIQKFKHVIDIFKNEIEIRDENDVLQRLILDKHDLYLGGFPAAITHNLDNKNFYTDVQWISKSLNLIFESIQKREKTAVSYSILEEDKDRYTLEILHRGSFNTGKSITDNNLNLTKGDFRTIARWLQNLCDWSIESEFKEGSYRLNFLSSNPKAVPYEQIAQADGFKHRLTFYK